MENMLKIEKYYNTKIEKMPSMDELVENLNKCILNE